jgi:hypothetical protein
MSPSGWIGWLLGWASRFRLDYSSNKSSGTRVSLGPSYAADFDLVDEFNDLSRKVDLLEARFNELEDWLVEK